MENQEKFRFKQKVMIIFALCAMTIIMLGISAIGIYAALRQENENMILWLSIVSASFLIIYIITASVLIGIFDSIQRRLYGSVKRFINAFPEEEREALERMCDRNDDILSTRASEWFQELQAEREKSRISSIASSASITFSKEIFWEMSGNHNQIKYGDYWTKNYGGNIFRGVERIDELMDAATKESFSKAVRETVSTVGKCFVINGRMNIGAEKSIRIKISGSSQSGFGEVIIFGTIRDVEQIRELREEAVTGTIEKNYLIEMADIAFYEVDTETNNLTMLNPRVMQALFDFSSLENFDSERRSYWDLIHPDYREGFIDRFFNYDHLLILPGQRLSYDYQVKARTGDWIWVRHTVKVTRSDETHTRVLRIIGSIVEINQIKRREFREAYLSLHDSLTGAYLRSAMKKVFNAYYADGNKKESGFLMIRINDFKHISEYYGHVVADNALMKMVSILWEKQIGKCHVGRIDDDTFLVTVMDINDDKRQLRNMVTSLFDCFNTQIKLGSATINMSLSIGCSSYPKDGKNFDEAFDCAMLALEVCCKNNVNKGNSSTVYDEELRKSYSDVSISRGYSEEEERSHATT